MEYGEYPVHAWSRYRHILRRQCPRKAVFHYREARQGADIGSTEFHRMIHDLRRHITAEEYTDRIFDEAVRQIFYGAMPENETSEPSIQKLADQLNARLERDIERIFNGIAFADHKYFILQECSGNLLNLIRCRINSHCAALQKELWKLIIDTPLLCRRRIASPLQLHINELCCYCAPLLAIEKSGVLWIVENNCDDISALLHKFYAVNTLGRAPELVRSFGYCRENGEFFEAGTDMNVSALLRRISEESACWSELTATPTEKTVVNPGHCPDCKYKTVCKKYFQS